MDDSSKIRGFFTARIRFSSRFRGLTYENKSKKPTDRQLANYCFGSHVSPSGSVTLRTGKRRLATVALSIEIEIDFFLIVCAHCRRGYGFSAEMTNVARSGATNHFLRQKLQLPMGFKLQIASFEIAPLWE